MLIEKVIGYNNKSISELKNFCLDCFVCPFYYQIEKSGNSDIIFLPYIVNQFNK